MAYKKGDTVICLETMKNFVDVDIFTKDKKYKIMDIINNGVWVTNNLYGGTDIMNSESDFELKEFKKLFTSVKIQRKDKINKLKKIYND